MRATALAPPNDAIALETEFLDSIGSHDATKSRIMQLPNIASTCKNGFGSLLLPMVEKKKSAAPEVRHPEMRAVLQAWKNRGGTTRAVQEACKVTPEMARRYMGGIAMPEPTKRKLLAKLIGVTPAELQYGKTLDARRSPALAPIHEITDDEQRLLEAYRLLPPHAKVGLRVRAVELLEEFGKPGVRNPFAKQAQ